MSITLDKKIIFPIVEKVVKDHNLNLYELNINFEFENDVIQVLVESVKSNLVQFDELTKLNEELSIALDNIKELDSQYVLEVSSAGIEKQIKNEDELNKNIGSYVFVQYQTLNKSGEFVGTIVSNIENKYLFTYFDKGQPKKIQLLWSEIKFVRFAINFKSI